MTKCLSLWPSKACGVYGACNENNTCICDVPGWTQSPEFMLFTDELDTSLCYYNDSIIRGIYGANLAVSAIGLIAQSVTIKTKSQMKRGLPALTFFTLNIIMSIWRLTDEDALLGVNVLFTFVFANILLSVLAMDHIAAFRVSVYLRETFPFIRENRVNRKYGELQSKFYRVVILLDVISLQSWWIASIFDDRETTLIIFRVSLTWAVIRYLYGFLNIYVLKVYILDIKRILDQDEHEYSTHGDSRMKQKLKLVLPLAIRVRNTKIVFPILTWPIFALSIVWDLWFQHLGYFLPSVFIAVSLPIIVEIFANFQKRKGTSSRQANENTQMSSPVSSKTYDKDTSFFQSIS